MKKTKYILSSLILLVIAIACVDKADVYEFPVDKYYYDIPDVPVTEDYVIGVRYNVIDSGYWFDKSKKQVEYHTGNPVLDSGDSIYKYFHKNYEAGWPTTVEQSVSGVLEQHLKWGKQAGIDFFVLGWGGPGWNDTLLTRWEQLCAQDNAYPKVVLRFDPGWMLGKGRIRDNPLTNDTLQRDPLRMDSLRFYIDSIYDSVLQKPFNYKTKEGKPVMILCNYVNKYPGEIIDLKGFVNEFRVRNNNNLHLIGELNRNLTSPEFWGYRGEETKGTIKSDTLTNFDAVYIENITTGSYDRWAGYYSFIDYNYGYWKQHSDQIGTEYIPTIFPAYDNKVRQMWQDNRPFWDGDYVIARWSKANNKPYVISATAENQPSGTALELNLENTKDNPYKTLANVAKRNVGKSRIIMVYSWNDFRIGNNLEPVKEFNEEYLNYTKEFFKKK